MVCRRTASECVTAASARGMAARYGDWKIRAGVFDAVHMFRRPQSSHQNDVQLFLIETNLRGGTAAAMSESGGWQ